MKRHWIIGLAFLLLFTCVSIRTGKSDDDRFSTTIPTIGNLIGTATQIRWI